MSYGNSNHSKGSVVICSFILVCFGSSVNWRSRRRVGQTDGWTEADVDKLARNKALCVNTTRSISICLWECVRIASLCQRKPDLMYNDLSCLPRNSRELYPSSILQTKAFCFRFDLRIISISQCSEQKATYSTLQCRNLLHTQCRKVTTSQFHMLLHVLRTGKTRLVVDEQACAEHV